VVGDDSCVDADCDRVGSLEWHEGPPFVVAHLGSSVRAHRRSAWICTGGPSGALTPLDPCSRATQKRRGNRAGHPCL
jgi:hypothetical protein